MFYTMLFGAKMHTYTVAFNLLHTIFPISNQDSILVLCLLTCQKYAYANIVNKIYCRSCCLWSRSRELDIIGLVTHPVHNIEILGNMGDVYQNTYNGQLAFHCNTNYGLHFYCSETYFPGNYPD